MTGCIIIEETVRQKDGKARTERLIVDDLAAYPNARVIARPSRKPKDGEVYDEKAGRWRIDEELKARRKREALARDPLALLAKIEALEARFDAMAGLERTNDDGRPHEA